MKLTWFGGCTLRVHIGGKVLVANADAPLAGVEKLELESGADLSFAFPDERAEVVDLAAWRPRRRGSMLDEADDAGVLVHHSNEAVLIDALGEPPLILVEDAAPKLGRWSKDAVVVLFGRKLFENGRIILGDSAPRLLLLAGEAGAVSAAFDALREVVEGTGLVAMEEGMAVEV